MITRRMMLALPAAGALSAMGGRSAVQAKPPSPESLDLGVSVGGDPCGRYRVAFEAGADGIGATTTMAIRVTFAMLTVYRYEQRSEEVWKRGRLVRFLSETNDNGTRHRVVGRAAADHFLVDGKAGRITVPRDVMPASFWRKDILSRSALLDPQDGVMAPQTVREKGTAVLRIAGKPVEVAAYAVDTFLTGTVFYDRRDRWVGARFRRNGRLVEYLPDA